MILNDLLGKCPRSRVAEARHEGNRLFGESKFQQACQARAKRRRRLSCEAYSEAAPCDAPDVVVLCNRSLARMKLEDGAGALDDAQLALALARQRSGQAMLAKAWLRLGQALDQGPSAFALAKAGAKEPLKELCARLSRTEAVSFLAGGVDV